MHKYFNPNHPIRVKKKATDRSFGPWHSVSDYFSIHAAERQWTQKALAAAARTRVLFINNASNVFWQ